jgi:adhesin transport system outer membrane protein
LKPFEAQKVRLCVTALLLLLPLCVWAGTLEQLITAALQSHPAVTAQRAQAQAAESGVDSALWQFYPTPSVAVEAVGGSGSDPNYRGDAYVTTLRLQQPLWTGGRLTAGLSKAQATATATQASLEEVRQQLALRVVQTYSDWLAAHGRGQSFDKSIEVHLRLSDQVNRRIEQGAAAQSDRILVESRLANLHSDSVQARGQRDTALARLGQLLGHSLEDAELIALLAPPRSVNAKLQALLDVSAHPTIQKMQAQAKVQEAVIDERRADLKPEVYLRAEQQFGNYSIANAASESRLFIGMNSRFGAGLSSQSNVQAARAQHQAALADVQVQERALSEQILADHALATLSQARMTALTASLAATGQVSESYERQFLAGRKTWQDVMNAAREINQTEVQLVEAQATQVAVTWRLAISTQGLAAVTGGAP